MIQYFVKIKLNLFLMYHLSIRIYQVANTDWIIYIGIYFQYKNVFLIDFKFI